MKRIFLATLLSSLVLAGATSANADEWKPQDNNPALASVPNCAIGHMEYDNSGWLIGTDGSRVDYHTLVYTSPTNAMSDAIWHKAIDGATVQVCKMTGRLSYQVR